jgi:hypothetical protein
MTTPDEPRVYARHIRMAGMCLTPGAKMFCDRYGIDWRRLLKEGIPISEVVATGDELGMQVVRIAQNGQ